MSYYQTYDNNPTPPISTSAPAQIQKGNIWSCKSHWWTPWSKPSHLTFTDVYIYLAFPILEASRIYVIIEIMRNAFQFYSRHGCESTSMKVEWSIDVAYLFVGPSWNNFIGGVVYCLLAIQHVPLPIYQWHDSIV